MSDSESQGQSNSKSALALIVDLPQSQQSNKTPQNKTQTQTFVENQTLPTSSEKLKTSKSSQKYLDYLEEMELRIRYMKNDIEFKQNQIQSRKMDKTLLEIKPKHSKVHVKEPRQILNNIHATPAVASSFKSNRSSESDNITSRFSTVTMNLRSTKWRKQTSDNLKNQMISQQLATLPLPVNSISATSVTSGHSGLSSYKVSDVQAIQSHSTEASLSAAFQLPKPMYLSPNKRSAIFLHNSNSSHSVSSHHSVKQTLFSTPSQETKNQSISNDGLTHTSNVSLSNSQGLSSHQVTSSDNKFKLVNTHPSKDPDQLVFNTPMKINAPNYTSTPNSSSTLVQKFKSRKTPTLKIQSAAKLVSKYKLKRLSPTSAVRLAPQLYRDAIVKPSSYDQHKNIHKLDRRKNSQNTDKKLKDTIDVIENKQKSANYIKHDGVFKPYNWNQMKLDKLGQANTSVHRLSEQAKNLHKLDRRAEKVPGHVLRRRRSKHHWVSHKLAYSKEESLVAEPPVLSQDYFQSSAIPNPKSQFKWLRPSLHVQNLLRQKMRQRLKMGYGRIHKYASFNTERSLWHQSQLTKARQHRLKENMIHIGGVLYKSSNRKLIRARRMSTSITEFDSNQVKKRHLFKDNVFSSPSGPSMSNSSLLSLKVGDEKTRIAASRAVYRSIAIATAKYKKNNTKSRQLKQHCIFFGRFGKCSRGDDCPYIHDAAKVAVCTRFLRGKCEDIHCSFSHKASVNKMPVCLFYLRGSCSRDSCPYLHVKVNPDAPVCRDFHNGFCSLGDKCKKLHSYVCPSFADTGICNRGNNCTMLHRLSRKEQKTHLQMLTARNKSGPLKKRRFASSASLASSNTTEAQLEFVQPMAVAIYSAPLTLQPSFISFMSIDHNPQTPAVDIHSLASADIKELRIEDQEMTSKIMPGFLTHQLSRSMANKASLDATKPNNSVENKIAISVKVIAPTELSRIDKTNNEQMKENSVHSSSALQFCQSDSLTAPIQPSVPIKIIPSFLSQKKDLEVDDPKTVGIHQERKVQ